MNEWLDSGLDFHTMKDHPSGHKFSKMYAGMFGAKAEKLSNIGDMLNNFVSGLNKKEIENYFVDQDFLDKYVYPIAKHSCLYHGEIFDNELSGNSIQKQFPSKNMYPDNHVGAALDELDNYVYEVDIKAALSKNNNKTYIYDFDLLES